MPTVVSKTMIGKARRLRNALTQGESQLWRELKEFRRAYGLHVRKQVPVGPYVADFVIQSCKLVIEVDGERHFEMKGMARDTQKDSWFSNAGYRVLRFNTGELAENLEGCLEKVLQEAGIS